MRRSQRRAAWACGVMVALVLALALPLAAVRSVEVPPSELMAAAAKPVTPAVPEAPAVEPAASVSVPDPSSVAVPPEPVTFTPVDTHRAAVVVSVARTGDAALDEDAARATLTELDGVVHVAGITLVATTLGGVDVSIAQVDPDEFRPLTPAATANHSPLWERLVAGDIAVTHEFGTTHDVVLGSTLLAGDDVPLRVGAYATNGTPPVAHAIVVDGTLTGEGTRRLLVALDPTASPTATVTALERAGLDAEEIPDPRAPRDDVVIPTGTITPENVWDHLAVCEASGNWQINTGNGYYGGLQFLPESWWLVGGTGLPHEHPRQEQIYRASLLWQIQGWEAWPQCARKLGLIIDPPQPAEQDATAGS